MTNRLVLFRQQEFCNSRRWTKNQSDVSKAYIKMFDNAIDNNHQPDSDGWILLGCFTDIYAEIRNIKPPIKKEWYYINTNSPLNCLQYKVL